MNKTFALDLIRDYTKIALCSADEISENLKIIKKLLNAYRVRFTDITFRIGASFILFEVNLKDGKDFSKVRSYQNDLSVILSGSRLILTISSVGIGIEIKRRNPDRIGLKHLLDSKSVEHTSQILPIVLGMDINNCPVVEDLTKMPHLLIAGATGQGKSTFLNTLIVSLIYCKRPNEVKFVMIDPKRVEFSLYSKIENCYLAKVPDSPQSIITDTEDVMATLNSLCIEMDERYKLLEKAFVKQLTEYNEKFKAKKLKPQEGHRFMPYIVVIIDEFADLIMTAGKDAEFPIVRLAQLARAVGIHVIIATQRPSTNVITGLIKANFPVRIAFKVSSYVDSKTILDSTGAQQLMGRGDILIQYDNDVKRVQSPFIDMDDIDSICTYLSNQMSQNSKPYILSETPKNKNTCTNDREEKDPLFIAA